MPSFYEAENRGGVWFIYSAGAEYTLEYETKSKRDALIWLRKRVKGAALGILNEWLRTH